MFFFFYIPSSLTTSAFNLFNSRSPFSALTSASLRRCVISLISVVYCSSLASALKKE
jgi:hypothetical protein